jgi:hypothetical protein
MASGDVDGRDDVVTGDFLTEGGSPLLLVGLTFLRFLIGDLDY